MKFWGQLWAARSGREYSLRLSSSEKGEINSAIAIPSAGVDLKKTVKTHAAYPRQLMIYDERENVWMPCTDPKSNIRINYLTISYRQADFPDKEKLRKDVEVACHELGYNAYWLNYL